jgi:hypothetical protein
MITAGSARRGRILLVEDDHEAACFAMHVLITMHAGPASGDDAARRQADAFLRKPVPAARLVAVALIGATRSL